MEEKSPPPTRPDNSPQPAKPHSSILRRAIVWLLVLIAFAGLFLLVLTQKNTPAAPRTGRGAAAMAGLNITVVPATAQKGNIGVYQEAIGTVTPVFTASVTSQVTGLVEAVHYTEGQLVQKGDPLIDIDPRPFEAQLKQAEGALQKDQQVLEQAKMDVQRYRDAWARQAIAKQILDDQEKLVLQDQGTVKTDEGVVQYDTVQLSYCHITAPFTGRAGLRLIDPGNVVQADSATPLVVITQEQPITVIFTVPEDALGQIQPQLRHGHTLTVDAYDRAALTKIASGKLLTIDNQIDTATGTVKMRAIFDNKNGALFPNQFVNTRLLVTTENNMTLIPTSAIQHNGQASFVYLIQKNVAVVRNITPGAVDGPNTAVAGIQPGDVVANSSFEKLQPNSKVVLAKGGAPPANSNGSTAP